MVWLCFIQKHAHIPILSIWISDLAVYKKWVIALEVLGYLELLNFSVLELNSKHQSETDPEGVSQEQNGLLLISNAGHLTAVYFGNRPVSCRDRATPSLGDLKLKVNLVICYRVRKPTLTTVDPDTTCIDPYTTYIDQHNWRDEIIES